jgi:hypothetical protein
MSTESACDVKVSCVVIELFHIAICNQALSMSTLGAPAKTTQATETRNPVSTFFTSFLESKSNNLRISEHVL